jgi:hypothetical protein
VAVITSGFIAPAAAVVLTPSLASAAAPLTCATNVTYVLDGSNGNFYQANETTGATTASAGAFGATTLNGFGVGPNGADAFAVTQSSSSAGAATVYELTMSTGTVTTIAVTTAKSQTLLAGAVNPATGTFYFAGYTGTGTSAVLDLYGVTSTGTYLGLVATAPTPNASTGDITFDGAGDLYILGGGSTPENIYSVSTTIPNTTETTPVSLTTKTLASISTSGNYYGISIDPNGYLYALNASTPSLTPINLNTGAVGTPVTLTGTGTSGLTDSGSCAFNGTLTVAKNIVGRANSGDQFTVTAATGSTTLDTGTTSGSTTGLQTGSAAEAGPVVGNAGASYTVSESAAGTTNLNDYASSYVCLDSGNTATSVTSTNVATGSKTFTVNALGYLTTGEAVTITDTANSAISLYGSITATSSSTPSITVNVTSVTGSGTGIATWSIEATPAVGTGTSATFNFPPIDGTSGATVFCTFTNAPALTITKTPSPTSVTTVGQVVTYTFVVTNTGKAAMTGVGVTDTQTSPAGSLTSGPTCQSLASPTGSCSGATTLSRPASPRCRDCPGSCSTRSPRRRSSTSTSPDPACTRTPC